MFLGCWMYKIDHELLASIRADKQNKQVKCTECPELLKQFGFTSSNLSEFIENEFVKHELAKYIKSNEYYISFKKQNSGFHYKPKDIVYADLGMNFRGEYSYERPCVVLKEGNEKIFIVPCSTSKHPYDRSGNLYPDYKVGHIHEGFAKDTVIILKDARWISKARVLSKHNNKVSPDLFKEIYDAVFSDIFDKKQKEFSELAVRLNDVEKQNADLIRQNESLNGDLEKVQKQLEELMLLLDDKTSPSIK